MSITPDQAYNAAKERMTQLSSQAQSFNQWQLSHQLDLEKKAEDQMAWARRMYEKSNNKSKVAGILGGIFSGGLSGAAAGGMMGGPYGAIAGGAIGAIGGGVSGASGSQATSGMMGGMGNLMGAMPMMGGMGGGSSKSSQDGSTYGSEDYGDGNTPFLNSLKKKTQDQYSLTTPTGLSNSSMYPFAK